VTGLILDSALAWRVMDHVDAHPEQHDQTLWWNPEADCGTAGCFAGWTVLLSGGELIRRGGLLSAVYVENGLGDLNGKHVALAAATLLGIDVDSDQYEAEDLTLFSERNTREDLRRLVAEIFGPRPAVDYGTGCRCPWLGEGTPEHAPTALCLPVDDVPPNAGSAS
jgi:hypothetical protein